MQNTDLTKRTTVIIPVKEAVRRTTNWRSFLSGPQEGNKQIQKRIPKAVYISKEDILDMAARLNDPTIVGARAYFTLNDTATEEVRNAVTFCMVMVRSCEGKRCGEDVIYLDSKDGDDDDDSGIYDYTRPCPDYCDTDSPLFTGEEP